MEIDFTFNINPTIVCEMYHYANGSWEAICRSLKLRGLGKTYDLAKEDLIRKATLKCMKNSKRERKPF